MRILNKKFRGVNFLKSIDDFIAFNYLNNIDIFYEIQSSPDSYGWKEFNAKVNGKKLILVGAGVVCEEFIEKYRKKYNIYAITDSNSKKIGRKLLGIDIISLEEINNIKDDFVILITSTKYNNELKAEFEKIYPNNVYSLVDMEVLKRNQIFRKKLYILKCLTFFDGGFLHNSIVSYINYCFRIMHFPKFYGKNEKNIKFLKNSANVKRCFIIAPGPSLTLEDIAKIKDEVTFGVNGIFKLFEKTTWRPNYYVLADPCTLPKYESENPQYNLNECAKERIFITDILTKYAEKYSFSKVISIPFIWWVRVGKGKKKLKYSPNLMFGHYDAYTVTNFAINIADYMGFKEIYLLGVDCNYSGNKQYFDNSKNSDITDGKSAKLMQEQQISGYNMVKKHTEKRDIKIYNATRGGELEVFKRVDLDSLVKEE